MKNSTVIGNLDVITLKDERFTNKEQRTREVRIWTPENYDKNHKYPVIYFHDGKNMFDERTSYSGEWHADESMTSLINNNFKGAILVGIDNTSERFGEYTYNLDFLDTFYEINKRGEKYKDLDLKMDEYKKTGNEYLNYIIDIVKPYVDTNYSTLKSREHTTIGGSSMGGLISLFGGLEHLDTFGNIISYSTTTGLVKDEEQLFEYFKTKKEKLSNTRFYFYIGDTKDGDVSWPENYKQLLIKAGAKENNIQTKLGKGYMHNEHAWSSHLKETFKWLYKVK